MILEINKKEAIFKDNVCYVLCIIAKIGNPKIDIFQDVILYKIKLDEQS